MGVQMRLVPIHSVLNYFGRRIVSGADEIFLEPALGLMRDFSDIKIPSKDMSFNN